MVKRQYLFAIIASLGLLTANLIGTNLNNSVVSNITSTITRNSQLAALEGAGSGLVAWWKFDEGSGTIVSDASGSGNNGTLTNGSGWNLTDFKTGTGALTFDGVDDTVAFSRITDYRTISFWFKLNNISQNFGGLFSQIAGANSLSRGYFNGSTGKIILQIKNSPGCFNGAVTNSLIANRWYHFALVMDSNQSTAYLDGIVSSTTPGNCIYDIGSGTDANTPGLGRGYVGGFYLNGLEDDVRIYNRALSASEITELYNYTGTSLPNPQPSTNVPPVVSAGNNQTITLPATITLAGTASDDGLPSGSTLRTTWSKVSGTGTVGFNNASSLSSVVTFSESGTYVLRLTASDSLLTSTADVTITVNPSVVEPPIIPTGTSNISFISPTPPDGSIYSASTLSVSSSISGTLPVYGFIDWQNSLVGWWRAESGAADSSSSGNNGTLQASASIVADGKFGKTFIFSGSGNDAVNIGDHSQYDFHSSDSFTISAWVYKSDNLAQYVLSKGARYYFLYSNSRWQFSMSDGTNIKFAYSPDASPTNKWVHLVAVYNGPTNNLSLFVNGTQKMSDTSTTLGNISTTYSVILGSPGYTGYNWNGKIDDILIFKRVLSNQEVRSLYDARANSVSNDYTSLTEGQNYSFQAHAVDSSGSLSSTEKRTISVDVANTPPLVTLTSPANNVRSDITSQVFSCSVRNSNTNTTLSNVSFFTDYGGTFDQEQTNTISGQSYDASFTKNNLTNKTFTWSCRACDTGGNCQTASANTFTVGNSGLYVATNGSDSNSGTLASPFLTIQKAASVAMPGDTVYIRAGTYRETITPVNSGSASNPITYKAYNNEQVTVSGADIVTNWSNHSGSIYKSSSMNWDLGKGNNQIFVDGMMMIEARWPNATDPSLPVLADIDSGSISGNSAVLNDSDLSQGTGYWNGATVHTVFSPRYTAFTATVDSSTRNTLNITFDSNPLGTFPNDGHYYLTGVYNALDAQREWFYNSTTGTLYLQTPNSDSPSGHVIEAKKRRYAFNLSGKSNIVVDGLHIFASTIITDANSHYITLDNLDMKYIEHMSVIPSYAYDYGTETTGVILNGTNNTLQNSTIAYSACNGVALLGSYNKVTKSTIHDTDYLAIDCSTVNTGRHRTIGNEITYSTLYNSGRDVVQHFYAEGMKILHNTVYNSSYGLETGDLGMIYTTTTNGQGSEIAYNRVYDTKSWTYAGIYLDNTNSNFNIHDNVVFGTQYGILLNKPSSMNVYNNTVNATSFGLAGNVDAGLATVKIKNNIFYNKGIIYGFSHASPTFVDSNNIYPGTDPLFVNSATNDYRLKQNSPAIDAGVEVGLKEDIVGVARPQGIAPDIGAYEYASGVVVIPVLDTTPPTISVISTSGITTTGASVTFTTNEPATTQIEYGLTTTYGNSTSLISTLVTSHTQSITSLSSNTTYHYRIISKDSSGNTTTSPDQTFTTLKPVVVLTPDVTPPTVSITLPTGGTVKDTVDISASASDPTSPTGQITSGLISVQFKLDNINLGPELTTPTSGTTYSGSWNTIGVTNGTHTLTVTARDAALNTKTSVGVTITVNNPVITPTESPTPSIAPEIQPTPVATPAIPQLTPIALSPNTPAVKPAITNSNTALKPTTTTKPYVGTFTPAVKQIPIVVKTQTSKPTPSNTTVENSTETTSNIDITVPQVPSWWDILKTLIIEVFYRISMGIQRTVEVVKGVF